MIIVESIWAIPVQDLLVGMEALLEGTILEVAALAMPYEERTAVAEVVAMEVIPTECNLSFQISTSAQEGALRVGEKAVTVVA